MTLPALAAISLTPPKSRSAIVEIEIGSTIDAWAVPVAVDLSDSVSATARPGLNDEAIARTLIKIRRHEGALALKSDAILLGRDNNRLHRAPFGILFRAEAISCSRSDLT